jgi:hypothetical protein
MDNLQLAKSLMEMPLDPPNVNPPANVEPPADAGLSAADVEPQSIVEPQAVDPAIESLDIEPPHVEWLPYTERLDTERLDDIERSNVEWQDIEWPDVERPDVERPQEIEPRSPELPRRRKGGIELFVRIAGSTRKIGDLINTSLFNMGRFLGRLERMSLTGYLTRYLTAAAKRILEATESKGNHMVSRNLQRSPV